LLLLCAVLLCVDLIPLFFCSFLNKVACVSLNYPTGQ